MQIVCCEIHLEVLYFELRKRNCQKAHLITLNVKSRSIFTYRGFLCEVSISKKAAREGGFSHVFYSWGFIIAMQSSSRALSSVGAGQPLMSSLAF